MTAKRIEQTDPTPKTEDRLPTLEERHPAIREARARLLDVRAKRQATDAELRKFADAVASRAALNADAVERLLDGDGAVDFEGEIAEREAREYGRLVEISKLAAKAEEVAEGRLRKLLADAQREHRDEFDERLREAATLYVAALISLGDAMSTMVAIDREAIAAGYVTNATKLPLWLVNLGDAPAFGDGGRLHAEALEFVKRGWVDASVIPAAWAERRRAFREQFVTDQARISTGPGAPLPGSRQAQDEVFTANAAKDSAAAKERIAAAMRWIGGAVTGKGN